MLYDSVANMVSNYQRQNLDMAITAEVSKKAAHSSDSIVMKLLDAVSAQNIVSKSVVAQTVGKGANLNITV